MCGHGKRKGIVPKPASKKSSGSVDSSDMDGKMCQIFNKTIPDALIRGLGLAGLQLMADIVEKSPKIPLDEGTLQGSISVHVAGSVVGTSPRAGGNPTPNASHSESDELVAVVGANTPYAARQHEHPGYNFQQKKGGEGAKFIEKKLQEFGSDYIEIVADTQRKALA